MGGDRVWNGDKKVALNDDYLTEDEIREWIRKEREKEFDADKYIKLTQQYYNQLLKVENESKN